MWLRWLCGVFAYLECGLSALMVSKDRAFSKQEKKERERGAWDWASPPEWQATAESTHLETQKRKNMLLPLVGASLRTGKVKTPTQSHSTPFCSKRRMLKPLLSYFTSCSGAPGGSVWRNRSANAPQALKDARLQTLWTSVEFRMIYSVASRKIISLKRSPGRK